MFTFIKQVFYLICNNYFLRMIYVEFQFSYMGIKGLKEDIEMKRFNKCELISKEGKTALVTGGARGIGLGIVKKLLECNMHVIIACRNVEAGEEAVDKLRKSGVTSGTCEIFQLNLFSLNSIRECASQINKTCPKLHILVNNAGVMFPPYILNEDGLESQWCINYLGPFLLTHLLLPLLIDTSTVDSDVRIVNVTSCAHHLSKTIKLPKKKIENKNEFITGIYYADSKAAQILFTKYLADLLKKQNIDISVFAVHPGIVNTDLFNGSTVKRLMPWVLNFCKDVDEGATSVVYPCISPTLEGKSGLYLSNCTIKEPSSLCKNTEAQERLFDSSLKELKLKLFFINRNK